MICHIFQPDIIKNPFKWIHLFPSPKTRKNDDNDDGVLMEAPPRIPCCQLPPPCGEYRALQRVGPNKRGWKECSTCRFGDGGFVMFCWRLDLLLASTKPCFLKKGYSKGYKLQQYKYLVNSYLQSPIPCDRKALHQRNKDSI